MLKKLLPKLNVFTRTSDQSDRRIKWSYGSKAKCKVLRHFQTTLIIHGFLMCKLTYSLKCICNLKINTPGAPVTTHRPTLSSPSYGPHTGNVSVQQPVKCHISSFFVFFLGDFATEGGSRHSAGRSSIVPKYRNTKVPHGEKTCVGWASFRREALRWWPRAQCQWVSSKLNKVHLHRKCT